MTPPIDWIAILTLVSTLLLGGGGVVAIYQARVGAKQGIREGNQKETDSLNARAIAIVETQFTFLVQPLQDKVVTLETRVQGLQTEIDTQRSKYWKAITHIRTLYSWIARHIPTDLDETTQVPAPPADLAGDI